MSVQYDIAEAIGQWLDGFVDYGERVQTAHELIAEFKSHGMHKVAELIREDIDREKCREYGVCPECGERLNWVCEHESHPYGAGTAVEHRWFLACPEHGVV